MVSYRKPVERSEHIIDYRIKRSPRGVIHSSAADVLARQKLARQARIEAMKAEAKKQDAYMRWLAAARGGGR